MPVTGTAVGDEVNGMVVGVEVGLALAATLTRKVMTPGEYTSVQWVQQ